MTDIGERRTMSPMNLAESAARYRLGELRGEDLPDIGVWMLEADIDSQAIRELAGLDRPTLRDAADVFERALGDAGQVVPSIEDARRLLLRLVLERVVRGEMNAGDGAYAAWWRAGDLPGDEHWRPEWTRLVGLASEYEDWPEGRGQLGGDIIAAAREALAILGPASA
ncbi:MAG TPA: hypothetical protein VFY16_11580 [Gemmatimonadaceae bacterium]|nr:hypothetical protein [Gemmatimonadaceae bacterium]